MECGGMTPLWMEDPSLAVTGLSSRAASAWMKSVANRDRSIIQAASSRRTPNRESNMGGSGAILAVAVGGVLVLIIILWFLTGNMDRSRITSYIEERGGRVVSITWAPFGK